MAGTVNRFVARRSGIVFGAVFVAALSASSALAQVSSLSLDFNGSGGGINSTGFDAAYNLDTTGFNLNFGGNGKLGILTLPGDTFGAYENDPDSAKNFFYSNFNVGDRAVLEARVNALNLNQNFHGGGIWMGTDEDHYIRLGLIFNSFEGGVTGEALRENEDRWRGGNAPIGDPSLPFPWRPGFDIEGRNLALNDQSTPTVGGAANGRDITAVLRLIRDHNAVAAYISTDNGTTFTRVGGETYSFNALATDATTLRIDNRTVALPNNPDTTSHSVEPGNFKVGAYALGGGGSGAVIQFDSLSAITGTPTYTGPTSGSWTDNANWNANNGIGAPTNIESTALLPSGASARNVSVASNITLTNLRLENAAGDTISGAGEVRFDWFYFPTHPDYYNTGPGTVSVTQGNHTISAPTVLSHLHQFDLAASTSLTLTNMQASPFNPALPADNADAGIRKLGAGTLRVNRLLTNQIVVEAGTLQVLASGGSANVSTVKSIAVTTGAGSSAKLDVTDNAMIVNYDPDPEVSPLPTLTALIKSAYGTGNWAGPGITSSSAAAAPSHAIGIAEASALTTIPSLFGSVDTTAVLLRYTYRGDNDLNGAVNFDDLLKLAQNYNSGTGKSWVNGDNNYDGEVNFDDLLALAQNYNLGAALSGSQTLSDVQLSVLGANFANEWTLARSLVPEPTSLFAVCTLGGLMGRRRRAE